MIRYREFMESIIKNSKVSSDSIFELSKISTAPLINHLNEVKDILQNYDEEYDFISCHLNNYIFMGPDKKGKWFVRNGFSLETEDGDFILGKDSPFEKLLEDGSHEINYLCIVSPEPNHLKTHYPNKDPRVNEVINLIIREIKSRYSFVIKTNIEHRGPHNNWDWERYTIQVTINRSEII